MPTDPHTQSTRAALALLVPPIPLAPETPVAWASLGADEDTASASSTGNVGTQALSDVTTLTALATLCIEQRANTRTSTPTGRVSAKTAASPVTVLVPAEAALLTTVQVPSAKPQHIQAAVPNLLEENTAADIETLHVAHGERTADGQVAVAAVDRAWFSNALAVLEAAGLPCRSAVIDALLLPWQAGDLTMLITPDRTLLRWGACQAGALPPAQLPLFIEQLIGTTAENKPDIQRCVLLIDPTASQQMQTAALSPTLLAEGLSVEETRLDEPGLSFLVRRLEDISPLNQLNQLNLLQGEFAVEDPAQATWRRWRPAVWAAGIVLAAQLVLHLGAGLYFQQRATSTHAQSTALYHTLFPHDHRLVNLRLQMQNHLDAVEGRGHSPFLTLFSQFATAVKATPLPPKAEPLQLRGVVYNAADGALQLDLRAPTIDVLDALQKKLQATHVTARIQSASTDKDSVLGSLKLQGS